MKSDYQIQKDVIEELSWTPFLNETEIGVAVKDGIVTLSGQVDSYAKKLRAENAAKKVAGVKAIAEDMHVGVSPSFARTDTEIAEAVIDALKWNTAVNENLIKIKVENGVVRMEGEVEWDFQRRSAINAVEGLAGVRSVLNLIIIKQKATPEMVSGKIQAALQRSASVDASKVNVDVSGNKVTLTGTVRSLAEKEDAEMAAWSAPGIVIMDNRLLVKEHEYVFED